MFLTVCFVLVIYTFEVIDKGLSDFTTEDVLVKMYFEKTSVIQTIDKYCGMQEKMANKFLHNKKLEINPINTLYPTLSFTVVKISKHTH